LPIIDISICPDNTTLLTIEDPSILSAFKDEDYDRFVTGWRLVVEGTYSFWDPYFAVEAPNASAVLCTTGYSLYGDEEGKVYSVDAYEGVVSRYSFTTRGPIHDLEHAGSDDRVAVAIEDQITILDSSGEAALIAEQYVEVNASILGITYVEIDDCILIRTASNTLCWSLDTDTTFIVDQLPETADLTNSAISPDGTVAISVDSKDRVTAWDIENAEYIEVPGLVSSDLGDIYAVDFSPDSMWLIFGSVAGLSFFVIP
jgi:hypothetical protein